MKFSHFKLAKMSNWSVVITSHALFSKKQLEKLKFVHNVTSRPTVSIPNRPPEVKNKYLEGEKIWLIMINDKTFNIFRFA